MKINELVKRAYLLTIGSSVICFLLGLLVFLESDIAVKAIAIILGVLLTVVGIVIMIRYFSDGAMRYLFGYSLLYALLDIIAGILMMVNPSVMYVIITVYVTVSLLLETITTIQIGLLFKKYDVNGWLFQFVLAVALAACAIVIIVNPIQGTLVITKLVAGIMMISAILNIVDCIIVAGKAKNFKKEIKDIFD